MEALFLNTDTKLQDLSDAGWYVEHSSGGGWWFRNRHTQQRMDVPLWIEQMVSDAVEAGMLSMQSQFKELFKGKPRYFGSVSPFIPKPSGTTK